MAGYIGAKVGTVTGNAADIKGDIISTDTSPDLTLKNTTQEDSDGGRKSTITFKGEQSGGEESTLAEIRASHDGTADDEKGDLIFKTNDGSDGASPTERLRLDSAGFVGINESAPSGILHVKGTSAAHGKVIIEAGGSGGSANNNFVEFNKHDGTKLAEIEVGETVTDGGDIVLKTTPASGSVTERVRIDNAGNVGIGGAASSFGSGVATLQLKGLASGKSGATVFRDNGGTDIASIFVQNDTTYGLSIGTLGATGDFIRFHTGALGSERMRIQDSGRIDIGATTNVFSNTSTNGTNLFNNGSHNISSTGTMNLFLNRNGAGEIIRFHNLTVGVGSISVASSSTAYNTTSDYRLKENIVDLTDGITKVKQLQPRRFNWIADETNTPIDGFIAHEAATVVPQAVEGEKDGLEVWNEGEEIPDGFEIGDNKLDSDGNTIPLMQGIDQSKLVPLLTAALQEAIAKIETLETKVAALEAE